MPVFRIFIINRAGSLIYDCESVMGGSRVELDKTFSHPLDFHLAPMEGRLTVVMGQRDGIRPGHVVLGINGDTAVGLRTSTGEELVQVLADPERFPISLKLGRSPLTSNEKIILASTFHSLHAIGVQIRYGFYALSSVSQIILSFSPEIKSGGIETLEADSFKLCSLQTVTGVKFLLIADPSQANCDLLLRKIYELYADFALKNPFYSLDMPIRCELFDAHLQSCLERFEKSGVVHV